jgi:hypothetical protein
MDDDTPVLRPFADILREMGGGQVAEDCAVSLAEVVRAVAATRKPGRLTLVIDVKPMKDVAGALVTSAKLTGKLPEAGDPVATVYYSDQAGNLVRDHPSQQSLFPRVVAEPDARISDARA